MLHPTHQLVNIFSPNPNDTHSGRTTPSSVGGAGSGRASALTVDSNATSNVSFDMQCPPNTTIHPIPRQGSFVVMDPDGYQKPIPIIEAKCNQRIRFNLIRHRGTVADIPVLKLFKSFTSTLKKADPFIIILPFQASKQH
jgi:hypothetical protein